MTNFIYIPTNNDIVIDEGGQLMWVTDFAAHHADMFIRGMCDCLSIAQDLNNLLLSAQYLN